MFLLKQSSKYRWTWGRDCGGAEGDGGIAANAAAAGGDSGGGSSVSTFPPKSKSIPKSISSPKSKSASAGGMGWWTGIAAETGVGGAVEAVDKEAETGGAAGEAA